MSYSATILMTEFVTHDVKRFIVERDPALKYNAGQGVEVAIDQPQWTDAGRPFTPTSLAGDKALEFIIKRYPDHNGVTNKLHSLHAGDKLFISEAFGAITYQGPGVFIAGGAGVTPFIALLRQLAQEDRLSDQSLIYANKTPADIICEKEWRHHLGERCTLACTQADVAGYDYRRIDGDYLAGQIQDFDQHFYVCGPPSFVEDINSALKNLGADPNALVFEE